MTDLTREEERRFPRRLIFVAVPADAPDPYQAALSAPTT